MNSHVQMSTLYFANLLFFLKANDLILATNRWR